MSKKLLLCFGWLATTVATLSVSLILYYQFTLATRLPVFTPTTTRLSFRPTPALAYAALPTPVDALHVAISATDARPIMIEQYFSRYHSPLAGLGKFIVTTADNYGLDPYLFVAIAQQESNLCKKIPENSYNCWGWGIHSRGTLKFTGYQEAITAVIQGLTQDYLSKGLIDPATIMSKYTPLSTGSWAAGVNQFLEELRSGDF